MKKVLLAAIAFVAVSTVSAQIYVGGSLGFGSVKTENKDGNQINNENDLPVTSVSISPEVGYYITPKFDVGIGVTFGSEKEKDFTNTPNLTTTTSEWAVAPFARYSFLQMGKFEVLAKAAISFGGEKRKTDGADEVKSTNFGIGVAPVLAYNLCDHIVLSTTLNFAGIGYASQKIDGLEKTTAFGLGVDTNDLKNTGDIQIGFSYKF